MSSNPATANAFTLNRDKFDAGLRGYFEETFGDDPGTLNVDSFAKPGPCSIAALLESAIDWGAIGSDDLDVIVYPIDSEYDNSIVIAVRPKDFPDGGPMTQTAGLSTDANRLTANIWEGTGADHLASVLNAILMEANQLAAIRGRA